MRTTTKLHTESFLSVCLHLYYTNFVSIFFTKQRHSTCLLSILDRHLFCDNLQIFGNLFINDCLYFCNLFVCHRGEMCKVKAKTLCIHIRTCLLNMASKHYTKCFLQQMSCTVIFTGILSICSIHSQGNSISNLKHTLGNNANMSNTSTLQMDRIFHCKLIIAFCNRSLISSLTTHCCIKWRLIYNDRSCLTIRKSRYYLLFCCQNRNLGIVC